MRGTLPLVCKRWKGTIYDAKGSAFFRHITLNYECERQLANGGDWQPGDRQYALSVWAIARWIHKNVERGNIIYPLKFDATSSDRKGEGTVKGVDVFLAIMGEKLQGLGLDGQTGLLDDFNFSSLWAEAAALQSFKQESGPVRPPGGTEDLA
ncbi:g5246 [Coccomyxa viridis]|uniref:G5246 protein n=1 Tax=Coccomyxa viridis TaxID=1274662 RepID=A0ABP1FUL2_9CHLO